MNFHTSRLSLIRILFLMLAPFIAKADFALRDGDTVVFLGDSITAARGYTKIVEHYTLMRFPERKVRFVNAGLGGDTAAGCLTRLDRDVFANKPTVVTVAFGINDIGWGTKADAEHKQQYLDGIRGIIAACRKHNARPVICSAAITAEASEKAEKGFLQTMTDEGLTLAASLGADTIDLQRGMREIQRRTEEANSHEADDSKKTRLHVADGVHLNDLGHLATGYVMLKGLGAPAEVSSASLDAEKAVTLAATGCTISHVEKLADGIAFTRLDSGLPLNLGSFSAFNHRWIPIPDGINGYRLKIAGLPPGEYSIRASGRDVGKTSAAQLAAGLNISSMTADAWQPGGPWDAQSVVVKELVDARDLVWMAGKRQTDLLPGHTQHTQHAQISAEEQRIIARQREAARPFPYRFEVRLQGKP